MDSQAALVALNSVSESWMEERIEELRAKRDLALELVRSIQDVHCPTPMGAFYIMPDVSVVSCRVTWSYHITVTPSKMLFTVL
jgi:aspartate aminotransferase